MANLMVVGNGETCDHIEITYELNEGRWVDSYTPPIYVDGKVVTYLPSSKSIIPNQENFEFDGWYTTPEFTTKIDRVQNSKNITVYAKYNKSTYQINKEFYSKFLYDKNAVVGLAEEYFGYGGHFIDVDTVFENVEFDDNIKKITLIFDCPNKSYDGGLVIKNFAVPIDPNNRFEIARVVQLSNCFPDKKVRTNATFRYGNPVMGEGETTGKFSDGSQYSFIELKSCDDDYNYSQYQDFGVTEKEQRSISVELYFDETKIFVNWNPPNDVLDLCNYLYNNFRKCNEYANEITSGFIIMDQLDEKGDFVDSYNIPTTNFIADKENNKFVITLDKQRLYEVTFNGDAIINSIFIPNVPWENMKSISVEIGGVLESKNKDSFDTTDISDHLTSYWRENMMDDSIWIVLRDVKYDAFFENLIITKDNYNSVKIHLNFA